MTRKPRGILFDDPYVRGASIPFVLWIPAAIVFHLAGGEGAIKVAEVAHERAELRALIRSEREEPADTTFEVLMEQTQPTPAAAMAPPENAPADTKSDEPPDPEAIPTAPPVKPATPPPPKPPHVEPPHVEPPKEEPKPVPPLLLPPKPVPVVPVVPAPAAPPPPPPPPLPEMDHRISVRQHVEKDQKDNPNASRKADDANTTAQETVARNRSHDQDMPNPSMGSHKGPQGEIGSGDKEDKVADSEDKKGNDKHAPGENAKPTSTSAEHEHKAPPVPPTPGAQGPAPAVKEGAGRGGGPVEPPSPGGAGPAAPEVAGADQGNYSLDPANPGGDGKSRRPGKKKPPIPFQMPVHVDAMGLNGKGMPGGPQTNLTMAGVQAAVGKAQLDAERAADGAARKSAHRGSWERNKFEKWRPAIENYEPSVTLADTTSLNAARVPFATYLNTIHNRIHPIFAEEFLAALDSMGRSNKMNTDPQHVVTHIEIVLAKDTGRIVKMGVVRTSGVTAFDLAALDSVNRAQPFGKAPEVIVSWDGNVYLHWEFHRDPFDACSTRNARPLLVVTAPKRNAKPERLTRPQGPRKDEREGSTAPLLPGR